MKFRLFLLCWWCLLIVSCSLTSDGTTRVWTLQQSSWVAAIAFGAVATSLNVILFWRGRPDKVKQAVEAAVKPLSERVELIEESMGEERSHREQMQLTLIRIEAETESSPSAQDISALHKRISDVDKKLEGVAVGQESLNKNVSRITDWLVNGGANNGKK